MKTIPVYALSLIIIFSCTSIVQNPTSEMNYQEVIKVQKGNYWKYSKIDLSSSFLGNSVYDTTVITLTILFVDSPEFKVEYFDSGISPRGFGTIPPLYQKDTINYLAINGCSYQKDGEILKQDSLFFRLLSVDKSIVADTNGDPYVEITDKLGGLFSDSSYIIKSKYVLSKGLVNRSESRAGSSHGTGMIDTKYYLIETGNKD